MNKTLRYSMVRPVVLMRIQAYLVTLPEWDDHVVGPVTHGDTYEEAIKHGQEALEALIASAKKHNEPLPAPQVYLRTA